MGGLWIICSDKHNANFLKFFLKWNDSMEILLNLGGEWNET